MVKFSITQDLDQSSLSSMLDSFMLLQCNSCCSPMYRNRWCFFFLTPSIFHSDLPKVLGKLSASVQILHHKSLETNFHSFFAFHSCCSSLTASSRLRLHCMQLTTGASSGGDDITTSDHVTPASPYPLNKTHLSFQRRWSSIMISHQYFHFGEEHLEQRLPIRMYPAACYQSSKILV